MSTDKGYVKMYRDVWEHWLWQDKPFAMGQAWQDLIMLANHEDKTILFNKTPTPIKRGSFITSLQKLADRWGWSRYKVREFLQKLQDENMVSINIEKQVSTTINIVNYGLYQDSPNSFQTATRQRQNSGKTATDINNTLKSTKEGTKKKKNDASYEAPPPPDKVGKPWEGVEWL